MSRRNRAIQTFDTVTVLNPAQHLMSVYFIILNVNYEVGRTNRVAGRLGGLPRVGSIMLPRPKLEVGRKLEINAL